MVNRTSREAHCIDCKINVDPYTKPPTKRCLKCYLKIHQRPKIIRFMEKVKKVGDCWIWTAGKRNLKYGVFEDTTSHRFSYKHFKGSIPKNNCVLHRCDTPLCVNPKHLFIGTIKDNNNDRDSKGRTAVGEKSGRAKLTLKEVLWIRNNPHLKPRVILKKLSIKRCQLYLIRSRKSWAHL